MTREEVAELDNGVYLITWKKGGVSLAAVGRLYDGSPWLAPVNWQNKGDHFMAPSGDIWKTVKQAEPLHTATELREDIAARKEAKKISRG